MVLTYTRLSGTMHSNKPYNFYVYLQVKIMLINNTLGIHINFCYLVIMRVFRSHTYWRVTEIVWHYNCMMDSSWYYAVIFLLWPCALLKHFIQIFSRFCDIFQEPMTYRFSIHRYHRANFTFFPCNFLWLKKFAYSLVKIYKKNFQGLLTMISCHLFVYKYICIYIHIKQIVSKQTKVKTSSQLSNIIMNEVLIFLWNWPIGI